MECKLLWCQPVSYVHPPEKSVSSSEHPAGPELSSPPPLHSLWPACCGASCPSGEHPGTVCGHYQQSSPTVPPGLLPLDYFLQLLIAHTVGNGIALEHTESIVSFKCWNFAGRKLVKKFRGVVGLPKVEVGWCGEHMDLSPAVLRGSEDLEGPLVFRICVQGPSCHGDSTEKGGVQNNY